VELAYPDDPPEILNRTARDFFVGALTPISLRENVLDLGPNSLDEVVKWLEVGVRPPPV